MNQHQQILRDKIRQQGEIAHGKGKSFQDHKERDALRNFLTNCNPFQAFWANYFGTPSNTTLQEDPLGEYGVDLGIVDKDYDFRNTGKPLLQGQVYGLIEVDVFNSWGESYPAHYKKFHVLERKLKYFEGTDYKYLTCTFNNTHTQMVCTTRENIERCHFLYGITEMWMPAIKSHDRVVRCPLDENVFWFGVS
jgi:hypothetical protein